MPVHAFAQLRKLTWLCSGPVMALLVSKPGDAIANFRELMGPTNAEKARAQAPDRLATHAYPRVACDCVALTLPGREAPLLDGLLVRRGALVGFQGPLPRLRGSGPP